MTIPKKPSDEVLAHIRNYFRYTPETGILERYNSQTFTWRRVEFKRYYSEATGQITRGCVTFRVKGKNIAMRPYHICWFLHYREWPTQEIDHKDRNYTNNRIDNLRYATRGLQLVNQATDKALLPGVSATKRGTKVLYRARIRTDGESLCLGYYKTEILAHEAYRRAYKRKYGVELDYPYLEWHKPQVEEISAGELSPEALADYKAFCEAVKACNQ